jgi:hypothetical protein
MSESGSSPRDLTGRKWTRSARSVPLLILLGLTGFWLFEINEIGRDQPPCETVCKSCDMALYQAHELKTRDPELFRRDSLFEIHHSFYPQTYARVMNFLSDVSGSRWTAMKIVLLVLGLLFISGNFLLNRRLAGDAVVASVATLLAATDPVGYPTWGFPHLKPNEFVGAATPLLLYCLYRGLRERGFIQLFFLVAAGLAYVHPPAGLLLLMMGIGTYLLLGSRGPFYREGLLHSFLILAVTLTPLVLKHAGSILTPPPLSLLLARSDLTFFPTKGTILIAAGELLAPLGLALLIYPKVRSKLTPDVRSFIEVIALLALGLSVASGLTYLWTSLARLVLWTANRFAYMSVFLVIALGLRHWRVFSRPVAAFIWLAAAGLALDLDSRGVNEFLSLRRRLSHRSETAQASAGRNWATSCSLPEAAAWALEHTQRDDLFLIPPAEADAGFRVLSRRGTVVTDKDGGASAYDGTTGHEWLERMKDVEAAYRAGSREALQIAAAKYGAQYILVSRKGDTPTGDAVFMNDAWIIWPTHIPVSG